MKLLYTCFEPFGGEAVNPSEQALALLPDEIAGAQVVRLTLPVSFARAQTAITDALVREKPDAVLLVGQAGGREGVTIEQIGINLADARIADNDGQQPHRKPVQENAPDGLFSTLPLEQIAQALEKAGLGGRISCTAGTFVCNSVLYRALYELQKRGEAVKTGFVHLPYLPQQGEPNLTAAQDAHALILAGEVTVRSLGNYTYMLRCADGTFYTGWTNDLSKRVAAHNAGKGAKYTRSRLPVELVCWQTSPDRETAMRTECQWKRLTRAKKLAMLAAFAAQTQR